MKIEYTGKYPALCYGVLKVTMEDGTEFTFNRLKPSGKAKCYWNPDSGEEGVIKGRWIIRPDSWPKDFPQDRKRELVERINREIPRPCCGGCL